MQKTSGLASFLVLLALLTSNCAQRNPAHEEPKPNDSHPATNPVVGLSDESKDEAPPSRAPESCAPEGIPVTPELNRQVMSEWGTLIQTSEDGANEFIRIVKNNAEYGYALWYCEGKQPEDGDYNNVPCWVLSKNAFEPTATDKKLRSCDLFDLLKDNGFGLPSALKIKFMLVQGPYPIQFPIKSIGTKRFCSGARNALQRCLGR